MALQFQLFLVVSGSFSSEPQGDDSLPHLPGSTTPFTKLQHNPWVQGPFSPPASPDSILPFWWAGHTAALAFSCEKEKRHVLERQASTNVSSKDPVTDAEQEVCEHGLLQLARCDHTSAGMLVGTSCRRNLSGLMAALQPGKGQKRLWLKTNPSLLEQDTSLRTIIWRKSTTGLRVIHLTSFKSLPKGRVVTEILN